MENFNNLGLPTEIISALDYMKITMPTEIQKQAIPIAMQGSDILASSQTGSGKTLAYLLPAIASILKTSGRVLVLVPTRELATQVRDTLTKVTHKHKISSAVLIGGEPMPKQYMQLKNTPQVVVGTPGRIIDHLTRGSLKLTGVNLVVLDEMDRMLDMGMKEQLEEIDKFIPQVRQVLMFSATMPKHIIALSQKYLKNPHRISVGSTTQAASQIKQEVIKVIEKEKFTELNKLLVDKEGSAIVFVKTKRGADQLAKLLRGADHKAEAIHGDLSQSRRDKTILSFRNLKHRVMVATDVAARGLDIPHTQYVINYDLPMCPEDYLHRIGRTGRAGAEGFAVSFVSPEDNARWRAIDRLMTQGETTLRSEMLGEKRRSSSSPFGRSGGNKRSDGNRGSFGDNRNDRGNNRRDDRPSRQGSSGRRAS